MQSNTYINWNVQSYMHPIPAHRNHHIHLILNVRKVTMDWLPYAWNCYDDVAGVEEEQLLVVTMAMAVVAMLMLAVMQIQQQMIAMVSNIIINNISNMMQLHSTH